MQPLLPSGLPDLLPPVAAAEFRSIHQLLKRFMAFGYAPVIPPLAEYESSLLDGQGAAIAKQVFRMMDPISREMLAVRADITTQIARIARSGLKNAPRPLRLCYAGYTLRTSPEPMHTRRQHTQIGLELFGATSAEHDAEVIAIACDALGALALHTLSLDLSAPALFADLLGTLPEAVQANAKEAARNKDAATLRSLGAPLMASMVEASGPATKALAALHPLCAQYAPLKTELDAMETIMAALRNKGTDIPVTIDLLDPSGFGYYSGTAYALFLREPAIEIAKGGHYTNQDAEQAAGLTFYIDDVLSALPAPTPTPRVAVSADTQFATLKTLQDQGYETLLMHKDDHAASAKAQGCTHAVLKDKITPLS